MPRICLVFFLLTLNSAFAADQEGGTFRGKEHSGEVYLTDSGQSNEWIEGTPEITAIGTDLAVFEGGIFSEAVDAPDLSLRGGVSRVSTKAYAGVEVIVSW